MRRGGQVCVDEVLGVVETFLGVGMGDGVLCFVEAAGVVAFAVFA